MWRGGGAGRAAALLVSAAAAAAAGPPGIAGTVHAVDGVAVREYLGFRYATAPRFEAARPAAGLATWAGTTPSGAANATRYGWGCVQEGVPGKYTSEDCLFLNVWAPDGGRSAPLLPVMVWIHGGGFQTGSGSMFSGQPGGCSALAATGGIVVVTINYRLGPLGFLPLPLPGGGNLGLNGIHDQIIALRWVQEHISRFGGDPGRVTIAGESAGSLSAHILSVSPLAKGLFHRTILESGAGYPWVPHPARKAAAVVAGFLNRTGVGSAAALRRAPLHAVAVWPPSAEPKPDHTVDLRVQPRPLDEAYGDSAAIHPGAMLLGANSRDGVMTFYPAPPRTRAAAISLLSNASWGVSYTTPEAEEIAAQYDVEGRFGGDWQSLVAEASGDDECLCPSRNLSAQVHAVTGGSVKMFVYVFARLHTCTDDVNHNKWTPPGHFVDGTDWASHASEIPYVFLAGQRAWGSCTLAPGDRRLSAAMAAMWASFVRDGTPRAPGTDSWPPFTTVGAGVSYFFGADPAIRAGYTSPAFEAKKRADCAFWRSFHARHPCCHAWCRLPPRP